MNKKGYEVPDAVETSGLAHPRPEQLRAAKTVQDPVCGMPVDPEKSGFSISYQDRQFFFCSASCELKFKTDPEHYIHANSAPLQSKNIPNIITRRTVCLNQMSVIPAVPSGPVPCIRKSGATSPEVALFVGWHSNL